eukprot:gene1900-2497_t
MNPMETNTTETAGTGTGANLVQTTVTLWTTINLAGRTQAVQTKGRRAKWEWQTGVPVGTMLTDGTVTTAAMTRVQIRALVANNVANMKRRAKGEAENQYTPVLKHGCIRWTPPLNVTTRYAAASNRDWPKEENGG